MKDFLAITMIILVNLFATAFLFLVALGFHMLIRVEITTLQIVICSIFAVGFTILTNTYAYIRSKIEEK